MSIFASPRFLRYVLLADAASGAATALLQLTAGAALASLLGLPQGHEGVLASIPYYKSPYVFMYRWDRASPLTSFDDPQLRSSRVGVQIIGDDLASTPAGQALALEGVKHVVGFFVYGDRPAVARMANAIARGDVDAGVAWGPAAG